MTVTLAEDPGGSRGAWAFYEKGDDAHPLRDAAGIEVEDIGLYRMRQLADTHAPTSSSGSVSGKDVTLYFDEALDESAGTGGKRVRGGRGHCGRSGSRGGGGAGGPRCF